MVMNMFPLKMHPSCNYSVLYVSGADTLIILGLGISSVNFLDYIWENQS